MAGPGTGKTQLLSLRAANILRLSGVSPNNILCLTFTDNAARNMRERLQSVIGQPAYHIAIHTFHSFGSEIIGRYPDFFTRRQMLQQIDELGRYQLLREIFERLPHDNPLSSRAGDEYVYLKDALSTISWLRQNALSPDQLDTILDANEDFMHRISAILAETFQTTPSPKHLQEYNDLLHEISGLVKNTDVLGFPEYGLECMSTLETAITATDPAGRFAPKITEWRNTWCQKDFSGKHVFKDSGKSLAKLRALGQVYRELLKSMEEKSLYDFDDMIMEVVNALETNADLSYSLQEQYQYIMVDEFQDTNKAQLRILTSLGNNPVNENRPNIMAVGDDDQAIYAFQGAEVSNMVAFAKSYSDPLLVTLQENYRSTDAILRASDAIASQISDRLSSIFPAAHKHLVAKNEFESERLIRATFPSELSQYQWIADEVSKYIDDGTSPEQIAVIAPRHRYLERLMPYLGKKHLPIAYERKEDILESKIVLEILTMAQLVIAISENKHENIDSLLSEVLGYEFWEIPSDELLELSLYCYNKHEHWLPVLLKHDNSKFSGIAEWLMVIARNSKLEPLEYVLDELVGGISDSTDSEFEDIAVSSKRVSAFVSPLRAYYFSQKNFEGSTDNFLLLLGQLSTLRQRLRQWKPSQTLFVADLIDFVEMHRTAGIKIIDTNPHTQTTNAVQVMTAFKAKGLEFEVVFVINAQDEVWGPTARSKRNMISLPKNLPIAPASNSDNDKLRVLYVALTRAKHSLCLTGYTHDLESRLSPGLSFIGEGNSLVHSAFEPEMIDKPLAPQAAAILSTDWAYRFRQVIADKPTIFEPIIKDYKLSVTHLNNFIDVKDSGPDYFLMHNLLHFPEAISPSAAYGDAIHRTLQWASLQLKQSFKLPTSKEIGVYYVDLLARKHLRNTEYKRLERRGIDALQLYMKEKGSTMAATDLIERGFNNEGVVIGGAPLSGKIDKLQFPETAVACVVDYKTGKPSKSWQGSDDYEKIKLHKYKQQLMFYKLLVENSASFSKKVIVEKGELDFIEPDENGELTDGLVLVFDPADMERFSKLIISIWQHISNLDFPDTLKYEKSFKGILDFEEYLISTVK